MSEFVKTKTVLTRKEHNCFLCLRKFPPSSKMVFASGKYDGEMYSMHSCETCSKIIQYLDVYEEGFGEGHIKIEMEEVGFKGTPEEFLLALTNKQ